MLRSFTIRRGNRKKVLLLVSRPLKPYPPPPPPRALWPQFFGHFFRASKKNTFQLVARLLLKKYFFAAFLAILKTLLKTIPEVLDKFFNLHLCKTINNINIIQGE